VSFRVTNAPQRETLLSLPPARGPSLLPQLLLRYASSHIAPLTCALLPSATVLARQHCWQLRQAL